MTINLMTWARSALSILDDHPDLLTAEATQILKSFREDESNTYSLAEKVAKLYTTAKGEKEPVVRKLIAEVMPPNGGQLLTSLLGSEVALKAAMAMVFATFLSLNLTQEVAEEKLTQLRGVLSSEQTVPSAFSPFTPQSQFQTIAASPPFLSAGASSSSSTLSFSSSSVFSSPSHHHVQQAGPAEDQMIQLTSQMSQLTNLVTQLLSQRPGPLSSSLPPPVTTPEYWRDRNAIKNTWRISAFGDLMKDVLSEAKQQLSSEVYLLGIRAQIDAFVALRNRLVQNPALATVSEDLLVEQFTFLQRHLETVTHYVTYNDARPRETDKLSKKFPLTYYQALANHQGNFDAPSLRETRKSAISLAGKRFLFSSPSSHQKPSASKRRGTPQKEKKKKSPSRSRSTSRSSSREKSE